MFMVLLEALLNGVFFSSFQQNLIFFFQNASGPGFPF